MEIKRLTALILQPILVAAALFGTATIASAQILTPNEEFEKSLRPPLDVQGQIVSLKVLPAAGETKVLVTGIPADELEAANVGLRARVRVGEDENFEPVTTTSNEDGSFVVDAPVTNTSDMKIDVKYNDKEESFEIEQQK